MNQGLPVSPTQIQFNPPQQIQYPAVNCPQEYSQAFQAIIQFINNELVSKAQQNPLRVFFWNLCASNNFQNQQYARVCEFALKYFLHLGRNGANAPPQQIALHAAQKSVEWFSAYQMNDFPMLAQYINMQQAGMGIQKCVNELQQVLGEMQRAQQMQVGNNMGMGMGGGMAAPFASSNNFPGVQQSWGSGTNTPFNGGGRMMSNFDSGGPTSFDRDYVKSSEPESIIQAMETPAQVVTQTQAPPTKSGEQMDHKVEEVSIKFYPTAHQIYRPAFQPSKSEMFARFENGVFVFGIRGNGNMDQNQHTLKRNFGTGTMVDAFKEFTYSDAAERMTESVNAAAAFVKDPLDGYFRVETSGEMMEIGFDGIWSDSMVERWRANQALFAKDKVNAKTINIFQRQATSLSPMIVTTIERSFLKNLAKCTKFADVVQVLKAFQSDVSVGLFRIIEQRLTKELNHFLAVELSIAGLVVDSFYEDANDLLQYFRNRYYEGGEGMLVEALKQGEGRVIARAVRLLDDEMNEKLVLDLFADLEIDEVPEVVRVEGKNEPVEAHSINEKELPPVVFLSTPASFTLLDFNFNELDIAFEANTSAALTQEHTPVFYALAQVILSEFDCDNRQHYVKTLDGRIFEISRGYLTNDCKLITLIK